VISAAPSRSGGEAAPGKEAAVQEAFSYRSDPAVPSFPDDRPILIFDGKCVMCSGFANFILRHDHAHQFRFMAAQTPLGAALYQHFGLHPTNYETNLLLEDGRVWIKSEASIRMFERLDLPWSMIGVLRLLPRAARDRLYDFIARNRLRWFGSSEACYLPNPSEADRFIT
jgi:predicted DCC family thiol-disulfide oxidoreductase YuxK